MGATKSGSVDRSAIPMRLLLIDDDLPLSDGLVRALRRNGYAAEPAFSVAEAQAALAAGGYGLVILDLGLPDLDGSEVVQHLRRNRQDTPVLVLSARDAIAERVRLLDIGADDYLVKPVAIAELLARIRALQRRPRAVPAATVALGALTLDLEGRRAFLRGRPLDLTAREWALLALLAARVDQVVSREEILRGVYADGQPISENAVDKLVSRLRSRLGDAGLRLRTIRGLGYYLASPDPSPSSS